MKDSIGEKTSGPVHSSGNGSELQDRESMRRWILSEMFLGTVSHEVFDW